MLNWILIVLTLLIGGYFLLVFFGLGMMGEVSTLPHIFGTILIMLAILFPLSKDLYQNHKLTQPEKQAINYDSLPKGQKFLIKGREYEFVKVVDGKIVVKRNEELEVFRIKFTEVELIK